MRNRHLACRNRISAVWCSSRARKTPSRSYCAVFGAKCSLNTPFRTPFRSPPPGYAARLAIALWESSGDEESGGDGHQIRRWMHTPPGSNSASSELPPSPHSSALVSCFATGFQTSSFTQRLTLPLNMLKTSPFIRWVMLRPWRGLKRAHKCPLSHLEYLAPGPGLAGLWSWFKRMQEPGLPFESCSHGHAKGGRLHLGTLQADQIWRDLSL